MPELALSKILRYRWERCRLARTLHLKQRTVSKMIILSILNSILSPELRAYLYRVDLQMHFPHLRNASSRNKYPTWIRVNSLCISATRVIDVLALWPIEFYTSLFCLIESLAFSILVDQVPRVLSLEKATCLLFSELIRIKEALERWNKS